MAISMQSCVDLIIGGHEEHLHKWPFQRLLFKLCLHIIYMVAQEKGHMLQIIQNNSILNLGFTLLIYHIELYNNHLVNKIK